MSISLCLDLMSCLPIVSTNCLSQWSDLLLTIGILPEEVQSAAHHCRIEPPFVDKPLYQADHHLNLPTLTIYPRLIALLNASKDILLGSHFVLPIALQRIDPCGATVYRVLYSLCLYLTMMIKSLAVYDSVSE